MTVELTGDYSVILVEGQLPDQSICWTALHPELPGCTGAGRTADEAQANLARSKAAWLMTAEKLNEPIPEPPANPFYTTAYLPSAEASPIPAQASSAAENFVTNKAELIAA